MLKPSQAKFYHPLWYDLNIKRSLSFSSRQSGKSFGHGLFLICSGLAYAGYYEPSQKLLHLFSNAKNNFFDLIWCSPDSHQAKTRAKKTLKLIIKDFITAYPHLEGKIESSGDFIHFYDKNGNNVADIEFIGIKRNSEGKRGRTASIVVVDEIADIDHEDYLAVISPFVKATRGIIACTGTPKPNLQTRTMWKEFDPEKNEVFAQFKSPIDEQLADGEITWEEYREIIDIDYAGNEDNPLLRQEHFCDWSAPIKGAILTNWKKQVYEHDASDLNQYIVGADKGQPYTLCIFKHIPNTRQLVLHNHHIFEDADAQVSHMAQEVKNMYGEDTIIILPHDSVVRNNVSLDTDYSQWTDAFKNVYKFPRVNLVFDRIQLTQKYMDRCFIEDTDRADETKEDLMKTIFGRNPNGETVIHKNGFDHLFDAFSYALVYVNTFDFNTQTDKASESISMEDIISDFYS